MNGRVPDLGAQATVCAGGRYDNLVQTLGGKATPAVGFAMGLERLILLLETLDKLPKPEEECDAFVISLNDKAAVVAHQLPQELRAIPVLNRVFVNNANAGFKITTEKSR